MRCRNREELSAENTKVRILWYPHGKGGLRDPSGSMGAAFSWRLCWFGGTPGIVGLLVTLENGAGSRRNLPHHDLVKYTE